MMDMTTRTRKQVKASLKSLQPRCGECVGFKCEKLIADNKQVCSKIDKTSTSAACPHFIADTKALQPLMKRDAFDGLVSLFQAVPEEGLRALASLLYNEKKTRKAGFHFGQKVYVRYRGAAGANYLSNFMIARIMSVSSEYIRLTSQDGKCNLTFARSTNEDHILTVEEFNELRQKMVAKSRLVDPDTTRLLTKRLRCEEEYDLNMTNESAGGQITTIDTVFKENKLPRRKQKKTIDLVDLVNGMMEGRNMEREAKGYKPRKSRNDSGGDVIISVSGD